MSFVDAFAQAHRAGQAAFNEGKFDEAFAGIAPDVEWHILPVLPDSAVLHGRDDVIRYFRGVREAVDWRVEAQEFIDAGRGRVVVRQRGNATGRTTAVAGASEFFQVLEVDARGLVARVREYVEREAALEVVGLRE
jgi:ketosteroid isomerase-like protein